MGQSDRPGIIKVSQTRLLGTLRHPSNLLIGVSGVLLGFRSPWGIIPVNVSMLAPTIFQVAGTMVALILPASQLASGYVSKLEEELPKHILKESIHPDEKIRITNELTSSLRNALYPALRASILVFISFLFSVAAMLSPPLNFSFGTLALSVDYLLVGLALGSLLVGSAWFLPTARYAFGLEVLNDLQSAIESIATHQKKENNERERSGAQPASPLPQTGGDIRTGK